MNLSIEFIPGEWQGDTYVAPKLVIKALTGTFEEAKPKIEQLLADMGAEGVELVMEAPIESHRDGHEHLHQGAERHA